MRDDALFKQKLVAFEISFGVLPLGLVFGKQALRLFELNLERARINLREKIAFVNELTFSESDTDELPIDAAANGYGIKRCYRSKSIEVHRKVAALRGGHDHGHDKIAHARPSTAFARRCGPARIRSLACVARPAEIPDADRDGSANEEPQPPKALRRPGS